MLPANQILYLVYNLSIGCYGLTSKVLQGMKNELETLAFHNQTIHN
jgi:hypothetical protein